MKIHTGIHHYSGNISQNNQGNKALPQPASKNLNIQDKPKSQSQANIKFEGIVEPDASLGKASTSYQKQSAPVLNQPLGQHIDIKV